MTLIYLGIFGALGVYTRFALDTYLNSSNFPTGTLLANLIGCLLAGFFYSLIQDKSQIISQYFLIGFCGALTTFSSYSLQGFTFLNQKEVLKGCLYLVGSPALGILFVALGVFLSKNFFLSA